MSGILILQPTYAQGQHLTTFPVLFTGELWIWQTQWDQENWSVICKICHMHMTILDMHRAGTKHIVRHMQKSVVQWSVISKFTCIGKTLGVSQNVNTSYCGISLPHLGQIFLWKTSWVVKCFCDYGHLWGMSSVSNFCLLQINSGQPEKLLGVFQFVSTFEIWTPGIGISLHFPFNHEHS